MRSVELDPHAIADLLWLIQNDRKLALRTLKLIQEAAKSPFEGTGKPEPLKHELAGAWSRRINDEHRLVYTADAARLRVLACRYHYDR
jgi:toxin YoeB